MRFEFSQPLCRVRTEQLTDLSLDEASVTALVAGLPADAAPFLSFELPEEGPA